jgi:hypothetical protein
LCTGCTDLTARSIATIGSLIPELGIAATRQDRVSTGSRMGSAPTPVEVEVQELRAVPARLRTASGTITLIATPTPIGWAAAELLAETRNELVTWVRHLCEARGLDYRQAFAVAAISGPAHSLCPHKSCALIRAGQTTDQLVGAFLLRNLDAIRLDEAGPEMHRALVRLAGRLERAVDNRAADVFVGPCDAPAVTAVLSDDQTIQVAAEICGADLMAQLDDPIVTCHECGATYRVADRREFMLGAVRGTWATAAVIANGLTGLDVPVTPSMVRQMAFRKEIFRMTNPSDVDAPPYYLVGDVMDVLARRAERRESKRRSA